jgi:DNA (cytosine-5)-methyltransferase 1
MARIIGEIRPRFVLVENSAMLVFRGISRVLGDLCALGYDAQWGTLYAADAGARHLRDRTWILADANSVRFKKPGELIYFSEKSRKERQTAFGNPSDAPRDIDGVANRMDRLKATGNGQVPAVVRLAWETLSI